MQKILISLSSLLGFSDSYSMISGSLWNYYRDEVIDDVNEIFASCRMNNSKATSSRSFGYRTKTIGRTPPNNTSNTKVTVKILKDENIKIFE